MHDENALFQLSQMNLTKMCRICGETLRNQFVTVEDHEEQIYKYLPVKEIDKDFPKHLCVDCLSSIASWNVFYDRCEKTQMKFASLLERKNIKSVSKSEANNLNEKKETTAEECDAAREKTTKKDDVEFSCSFCSIHAKSQHQLNDHMIAVHCDLVFCCDLCKNYKPRDDLITHMTEHALSSLQPPTEETTRKTDKFQCPECKKQLVTNSGLKYHMNASHTAFKQFACKDCEHIFSSKRVLLNHFRSVHSKEKQFKCNDCNKRFKTDSTLYAHQKTHSKEMRYKCFDCGKGFKFKHHLDVHLLQHKPIEKKFECSCCHKKFVALNNLTKHRKIHDKTMDFVCHICGVKTMQKRYLRDHMKRVHQTRLDSLDTAN